VNTQVNVEMPVSRPSLAEQAYLFIRDRLVMLDIKAGEPINEEWLGGSLGMGRTPIREALKRLEAERLVIAFPRRGTFATDINISDLAHISEVRRTLEPAAAAAAAERATATDQATLTALREQLDVTGVPGDNAELLRTDLNLHRSVYRCVHNPFLEDTLIHYDNLATRIWCLFVPQLRGMAGHVHEHVPMLTAVIDGDATKAAELALGHVTGFERAIRALI
jgi:DNA-binding GntR family transcriptional regulator